MSIQKVMVVGAGQMGSGIAQVFAQSGYEVILNDLNQEALQKGIRFIEKVLSKDVAKGKITEKTKRMH